jgi:hypothetical protein
MAEHRVRPRAAVTAGVLPPESRLELNGISLGLQQIEAQNHGDPHNGLVTSVVNELNQYILANGGTLSGGGGGGTGPRA